MGVGESWSLNCIGRALRCLVELPGSTLRRARRNWAAGRQQARGRLPLDSCSAAENTPHNLRPALLPRSPRAWCISPKLYWVGDAGSCFLQIPWGFTMLIQKSTIPHYANSVIRFRFDTGRGRSISKAATVGKSFLHWFTLCDSTLVVTSTKPKASLWSDYFSHYTSRFAKIASTVISPSSHEWAGTLQKAGSTLGHVENMNDRDRTA